MRCRIVGGYAANVSQFVACQGERVCAYAYLACRSFDASYALRRESHAFAKRTDALGVLCCKLIVLMARHYVDAVFTAVKHDGVLGIAYLQRDEGEHGVV